MNGLVNSKLIMDAWVHLRKTNNTIPNETLDFIRDVSIEKAKSLGFDGETDQDNKEYCEKPNLKADIRNLMTPVRFYLDTGENKQQAIECIDEIENLCGKEIKIKE